MGRERQRTRRIHTIYQAAHKGLGRGHDASIRSIGRSQMSHHRCVKELVAGVWQMCVSTVGHGQHPTDTGSMDVQTYLVLRAEVAGDGMRTRPHFPDTPSSTQKSLFEKQEWLRPKSTHAKVPGRQALLVGAIPQFQSGEWEDVSCTNKTAHMPPTPSQVLMLCTSLAGISKHARALPCAREWHSHVQESSTPMCKRVDTETCHTNTFMTGLLAHLVTAYILTPKEVMDHVYDAFTASDTTHK